MVGQIVQYDLRYAACFTIAYLKITSLLLIAQKRDMMWYDFFSTSLVSAQCTSFISWRPLLKGGRLHIRSWETTVVNIMLSCFKYVRMISFWWIKRSALNIWFPKRWMWDLRKHLKENAQFAFCHETVFQLYDRGLIFKI